MRRVIVGTHQLHVCALDDGITRAFFEHGREVNLRALPYQMSSDLRTRDFAGSLMCRRHSALTTSWFDSFRLEPWSTIITPVATPVESWASTRTFRRSVPAGRL